MSTENLFYMGDIPFRFLFKIRGEDKKLGFWVRKESDRSVYFFHKGENVVVDEAYERLMEDK